MLFNGDLGLFNFDDCSIKVLEEQSMFLNNMSVLGCGTRLDGLDLVNSNKVDESVDSILVINCFTLGLDDAVLLLSTSNHPLEVPE
jgi:hypothetical protein